MEVLILSICLEILFFWKRGKKLGCVLYMGKYGTKTWNDLKPSKTTHNHLKNFKNHQPPQKHLQPLANYIKPSKTRHKCLK